jgi:hypothetical protein
MMITTNYQILIKMKQIIDIFAVKLIIYGKRS